AGLVCGGLFTNAPTCVAGAFPVVLELASLDGTNGFVIHGVDEGDTSGRSVAAAGDVNGDGMGDLLIGAIGADPSGVDGGAAYVVFGRTAGFPAEFELASLDGTDGFVLEGEEHFDSTG